MNEAKSGTRSERGRGAKRRAEEALLVMWVSGVLCQPSFAPCLISPCPRSAVGGGGVERGARSEATSKRLLVMCEERSDKLKGFCGQYAFASIQPCCSTHHVPVVHITKSVGRNKNVLRLHVWNIWAKLHRGRWQSNGATTLEIVGHATS